MHLKRFWKVAFITGLLLALFTVVASANDDAEPETELKIGVGIVDTDSGLRLRAKPTTDADVISTAMPGDTVVVIRDAGDWWLVDYNLDVGYMSKEFVLFKDVESVDLGTAVVEDALVNVRDTYSTDGNLVVQLSQGTEVSVIGINSCWYKIQYGDAVGYVRSDLLALSSAPGGNSSGASAAVVSLGNQVVSLAYNYLGVPYVWGGTTTAGFDCSGYTKYVFAQFGITLNRTAAQQLGNGYSISYDELQPGDLVFFGNTYSSYEAATHVGIYVGGGQFIHSASGGVKVTSLSDSYYATRYVGARRVL